MHACNRCVGAIGAGRTATSGTDSIARMTRVLSCDRTVGSGRRHVDTSRVPQRDQSSLLPFLPNVGQRFADPWRGLRPYWNEQAPPEPRRAPIAVTMLDLGPTECIRWHRQGEALLGFPARGGGGCLRIPMTDNGS